MSPELIPRLEAAMDPADRFEIPWSDFTITDNTCKQQTESNTVLRERLLEGAHHSGETASRATRQLVQRL